MKLTYAVLFYKKRLKQLISVSRAILKNQITLYPDYLLRFESQFGKFTGRNYALSFCNGTSAIEAALYAVGIGPGDEVIVPSCTFHASIDPICNFGAQPVFADVDAHTFTICADDIRRKITDRTKAIVVVHLFGIPADMKSIIKIAKDASIHVIEDASHAHGATADGRVCGGIGRIGAFSLQGTKAVAAGEGGMAVTDSREDFLRMSFWGHFNRHGAKFSEIGRKEFEHTGWGTKRRMAPLSALLAKADLDDLAAVNNIMNETCIQLDKALGRIHGVRFPRLPEGSRRGGFFSGYAFSLGDGRGSSQSLIGRLAAIGIDAKPYPFARHHQLPVYDMKFRRGEGRAGNSSLSLKNTELLETKMVLLPRRYLVQLSKAKIRKLASIIEQEMSS